MTISALDKPMIHRNDRRERISTLRGRAQELEAKLEDLSKSLVQKPGLYMAMSDREANAPNELSMQKFQSLRVMMAFSDGWAHCVNEDTGDEGIVPLSCLKSMDGFQVSECLPDHVKEKKLLKKLSISDDILVKEPGVYTCVKDRIAERVNEISLEKGKEVRVLMVFSDGWGLCLDESTGEQGIAPLNILKLQGFNLDSGNQRDNTRQSSTSLGYYRVLVDRIPIQANEVLLLIGNVVHVSAIYSDGWCHCMNIDTMETGDCPFNVLEWIEDQSLSNNFRQAEEQQMMVESINGAKNQGSPYRTNTLHFNTEKSDLHPIIEVSNDLENEIMIETKKELNTVHQDQMIFGEKVFTTVETEILESVSRKAVQEEIDQVATSAKDDSTVENPNLADLREEEFDQHQSIEVLEYAINSVLEQAENDILEETQNNILEETENDVLQKKITEFHQRNIIIQESTECVQKQIHQSSDVLEESTEGIQKQIENFTYSEFEVENQDKKLSNISMQISEIIDSKDGEMIVEEITDSAETPNISLDDSKSIEKNVEGDGDPSEFPRTESKFRNESESTTTETITTFTSQTKNITVFSAAIGDGQSFLEKSIKRIDTFTAETDSDITLSHSPSFEKSQHARLLEEENIFKSFNALVLENGLKFIEINSSETTKPHNLAAIEKTKKSILSRVKEKLPQDSQDVISILRLIRMISIFLLAVQFLGFVSYSLVNTFLILKNHIISITPVKFTAHDIYIWLRYILIDVFEIDQFPVFTGNALAIIALIATVWEGVLIGFVNQIMVD